MSVACSRHTQHQDLGGQVGQQRRHNVGHAFRRANVEWAGPGLQLHAKQQGWSCLHRPLRQLQVPKSAREVQYVQPG